MNKHPHKGTSRLTERIGLGANSLKKKCIYPVHVCIYLRYDCISEMVVSSEKDCQQISSQTQIVSGKC